MRRARSAAADSGTRWLVAPKDLARLTHAVREQAHDHPGRAVAVALGVGFVAGGGLFSAVTGRLVGAGLRLGLKMALLPFLADAMAEALTAISDRAIERRIAHSV